MDSILQDEIKYDKLKKNERESRMHSILDSVVQILKPFKRFREISNLFSECRDQTTLTLFINNCASSSLEKSFGRFDLSRYAQDQVRLFVLSKGYLAKISLLLQVQVLGFNTLISRGNQIVEKLFLSSIFSSGKA